MGKARLALVGGCGSSGTTLLIHLLSRHPQVATAPELNFFNHPETLELARFTRTLDALLARHRLTPGYKQVATFLGPRDELELERARLADWAARARDAAELRGWLAEHVCARVGATHFVEKTPTNVYAFAQLARESPDVRLVHLIRDGRDVAASLAQRGRSLFAAGSRWLYDTLAGRQARGSPAYLELRYEDLVTHPEATLARVFAHLGLPDPVPTAVESGGRVPETWRRKRAAARWSRTPDQPVSAASVGRFRQDLDGPSLALLHRIRLTAHGARALDAPVASFAELLPQLGYESCEVPRVGAADGATAWLAVAADAARRSLRSLRYTGRPARPLTTLAPAWRSARSGAGPAS
jgi:hypothetical protein